MNIVEKSIKVYDAIAQKYSSQYDDDLSDNPRIDKFSSYLPDKSFVIDIGCGTGAVTKYIYSKGIEVIGMDLSEEMIKIAKANHPQIEFKVEDIRTLTYPENTFNGIWAGHCLFHLSREDFILSLDKFSEMLKKDGVFGFVMNEGEGYIELPEPLDDNLAIPLTLYSVNELTELLEKAGFKVEEIIKKEPIINSEVRPYQKIFFIATK
jgi:SAM-dependent methyltransferase